MVVRVNGVKNKLFALAVEDIQLTIDATRHQLGIGATKSKSSAITNDLVFFIQEIKQT